MRIKKKRGLLAFFLLLLIVIVTSPLWLTWIANVQPVKSIVAEKLAKKTQQQLLIDDFHVQIFPTPRIQISDITYTPASFTGSVSIGEFSIGLSLSDLVKGKFVIDRITLLHPDVDPALFKSILDMPQPSGKKAFLLPDPQTFFSLLPEDQKQLDIEIVNLKSPFFDHLSGSVALSKSKGTIAISAMIDQLSIAKTQLPQLKDLPLAFSSLDIGQVKLGGILDGDGKLSLNVSILDSILLSAAKKTLFNAKTIKISVLANQDGYQVSIDPFKVTYPNLLFGFDFISRPAKTYYKIGFTGSDINVEQVRQSALTFFNNEEITQNLFDIVRSGKASQVLVNFESNSLESLLNEDNMMLTGDIQNGVVKIPETQLTAQKVIGKARIEKGVLKIDASNGLIGRSRIESGKLDIDLMNFEDYPFDGTFKINADLPELPAVLISLLEDTLLAKELSLIKEISGTCPAQLKLSLETGSDDLIVHVNTQKFSATGTYERIPGLIQLNDILFSYQPNQVLLQHFSGVINDCKFENVLAAVEIEPTNFQIHSGSAQLNLDNVIAWLTQYQKTRKLIAPFNRGSGSVSIKDIRITGPPADIEAWQFSTNGSGYDISLSSQDGKYDIESLSGDFQIANQRNIFNNISGKINTASWLTRKDAKNALNKINLPVKLRSGKFKGTIDKVTANGVLYYDNGISLSFGLQGKKSNKLSLDRLKIHEPDVSDASLQFFPQNGLDGMNFNGRVNTTSLYQILNPNSSWTAMLDRLTRKEPMTIEAKEKSQLAVTAGFFNANALFSSKGDIEEQSAKVPRLNIQFKGDRVAYKKFSFTNVDSQIDIIPNTLNIRMNNANLCDLSTKGYFNLKNGQLNVNLPFSAIDKPDINSLLTCLMGKDNLMDGKYSLTSHLSARAAPSKIKRHFNGDLEFKAIEGRIYKLTLISRILSVINVSKVFRGKIPDISQQGFAYNDIIVEADIKDSVIHFKKAIIDGRDMTLIFAGSIDPVKDTLNLDCLVAPFKTVDLIIENIPIINTVFNNRLVSVPVKITGELSDPTVVPLHPASVGKGLVNMMTGILKTPIRLFNKFSDEDKNEE